MFNKILIANRGEIAVRIIKTAKKLGINTVAIYSIADKDALFVREADESYCIGPANASQSYLRIDKILEVCKQAKVEAVHPGYGFLSENADFAKACEKANIKFIGPRSKTIRDMGSKAKAKSIMAKAGVPVIPGYYGDNNDPEFLLHEAERIGFPVLIKASLGGGGKGMRLVKTKEEFLDLLAACKREAVASFGNDEVILEKYILYPRHIEVQIFGDNFGNVLHLYERDCSIQRRHQKIIEEAPASIRPDVREKLGKAALKAAFALGYVSAGTIEFLMDDKENFYFMEMNTRLQVEHPITEMITGLDLVEWQILVAANEKLPLSQDEIKLNGHAMEARIYAEDPANDFLPTTGKIYKILTPKLSEKIRFDTGIKDGDKIDIHYDPMLAKLIVHANNRFESIIKLKKALSQTHFLGLNTNVSFLRNLLTNNDFVMENVSTHFLEKIDYKQYLPTELAFKLTAAAYFLLGNKLDFDNKSDSIQQQYINNWRLNHNSDNLVSLTYKSELLECRVQKNSENELNLTFNNTTEKINYNLHFDNKLTITMNEDSYDIFLCKYNNLIYSSINTFDFHFYLPTTDYYVVEHHKDKGSLIAPMPGTITKIMVNLGDKVKINEPLLIIEAMKMEHTVISPINGIIKDLHYNLGETVEEGVTLLALEMQH